MWGSGLRQGFSRGHDGDGVGSPVPIPISGAETISTPRPPPSGAAHYITTRALSQAPSLGVHPSPIARGAITLSVRVARPPQQSTRAGTISDPTLTGNGPNLDLDGQGTDWAYYHGVYLNGIGWRGLTKLSGTFIGQPSQAPQNGVFDVFGQEQDMVWYHQQETAAGWSALETTGGSGFGAPYITPVGNLLHIIVAGSDHRTWFNTLENTNFSGWAQLNGPALH